jgi:ribonuclease J
MKQNVALARSLAILRIPDDKLIDISRVDRLDPGRVCIISTGSQGEPRSALALMATESSKWLAVGPTDTVILSSHPIPGNENNVSRVLNGLVKLGAEVVHSGIHDVHATGHAKQEELKTLLSIIQPEWFGPSTASTATNRSTPPKSSPADGSTPPTPTHSPTTAPKPSALL